MVVRDIMELFSAYPLISLIAIQERLHVGTVVKHGHLN
jgi:hypothetical protein